MAKLILQCRQNSHPFNDREIPLNIPVKVGRAVAGCKPANDNGYFNCKVLSRNHALLFYENGKFYLQDTQSSNGTFVNTVKLFVPNTPVPPGLQSGNQGTLRNEPNSDGRQEIFSGDVVQFGVEVLEPAKKNQPPVTHGCIVASVRLFHPDGTERKSPTKAAHNGVEDGKVGDIGNYQGDVPKLTEHEIFELHAVLREACHREHLLESKLSYLNDIFSTLERKDMFNATFQEDFLLSKIQYLEGQLRSYDITHQLPAAAISGPINENMVVRSELHKEVIDGEIVTAHEDKTHTAFLDKVRDANLVSDDYRTALIAEWKRLLEERADFEAAAKDALQRALSDKFDATKSLALIEDRLHMVQSECDALNEVCRSSQQDLLQLVEKFQSQCQVLDQLSTTYEEAERTKLQCLEALASEKTAADERFSDLQQRFDEERVTNEELRAECLQLRKETRHHQDRSNHPVANSSVRGDKSLDASAHRVNGNGYCSEGELDEDDDDPKHHSLLNANGLEQHNIFVGKSVSDLLHDMQDVDSDDDVSGEYVAAPLLRIVSVPESEPHESDASRTKWTGWQDASAHDESVNSNLIPNSDVDMLELVKGRQKLADLVNDLQTQLELEREQVRRLKDQLSDSHPTLPDVVSVPADLLVTDMQNLTLNETYIEEQKAQTTTLAHWLSVSVKELDVGAMTIFSLLLVWLFCMPVIFATV